MSYFNSKGNWLDTLANLASIAVSVIVAKDSVENNRKEVKKVNESHTRELQEMLNCSQEKLLSTYSDLLDLKRDYYALFTDVESLFNLLCHSGIISSCEEEGYYISTLDNEGKAQKFNVTKYLSRVVPSDSD